MSMTELERMAREILADHYLTIEQPGLARYVMGGAPLQELSPIMTALTKAPPGWKLVPIVPPEEMNDAGRSAVMARDCSGPNWGAGDHYKAAGLSTKGIDPRLLSGKGFMSKGHCADLVWQAMLAAAPEYKEGE